MRRIICIMLAVLGLQHAMAQDTIWVKYDNRFKANKSFSVSNADSIEFRMSEKDNTLPIMKIYRKNISRGYVEYRLATLFGTDGIYSGSIMTKNPGRILYKPSTYSTVDYTNDASRWSFNRSMESEHFVVFWEKGFGDDPTRAASSYRFNPKTMLENAEKILLVSAKLFLSRLKFRLKTTLGFQPFWLPLLFATKHHNHGQRYTFSRTADVWSANKFARQVKNPSFQPRERR